ncbi:MAG: hypothetical protein Satyrvirus5_13 [Satyrvirus sp.]|uniref:Uncharacterized protein n=1 Tax=Satyrvirus sp. TaxID=2487771 RepID=A0A3G5ADE8_9VIRU|nr:MAG: hypothetical protein Satyrvirus5_13 [Satyrvirus sp.]
MSLYVDIDWSGTVFRAMPLYDDINVKALCDKCANECNDDITKKRFLTVKLEERKTCIVYFYRGNCSSCGTGMFFWISFDLAFDFNDPLKATFDDKKLGFRKFEDCITNSGNLECREISNE